MFLDGLPELPGLVPDWPVFKYLPAQKIKEHLKYSEHTNEISKNTNYMKKYLLWMCLKIQEQKGISVCLTELSMYIDKYYTPEKKKEIPKKCTKQIQNRHHNYRKLYTKEEKLILKDISISHVECARRLDRSIVAIQYARNRLGLYTKKDYKELIEKNMHILKNDALTFTERARLIGITRSCATKHYHRIFGKIKK